MAVHILQEWINSNDVSPYLLNNVDFIPICDYTTGKVWSRVTTTSSVRGSIPLEGKVYIEMYVNSSYPFGLMPRDKPFTSDGWPVTTTDPTLSTGDFFIMSGSLGYISTTASFPLQEDVKGKRLMIAYDVTTGEIWMGTDGNWWDNPASDPSTVNINPNLTLTTGFRSAGLLADAFTLPLTESDYVYTVPTGFTPVLPNIQGLPLFDRKPSTQNELMFDGASKVRCANNNNVVRWVRSTDKFKGKLYLEIHVNTDVSWCGFCSDEYGFSVSGVGSLSDVPIGSGIPHTVGRVFCAMGANRIYTESPSNIYDTPVNVTISTGKTIMLAMDTVTGECWFGVEGSWEADPNTEPASYTVDAGLEWTYFTGHYGSFTGWDFKTSRDVLKYPIPTGFKPLATELSTTGTIVDNSGSPIEGKLRVYETESGKLFFESDSDGGGNFTVALPESLSYVTCIASPGYLTEGVDNTAIVPIDFNYGTGGGVEPDPTFTAKITGNVTRLGVPFGTDIIAISKAVPPTVVGVTTSDPSTGDYTVDVAPYTGKCDLMAVPDYGVEWVENTVFTAGVKIRPTTPNGFLYSVTEAGTTDNTEPTWPTQENQVVVSGSVTMIAEYMLRPLVNSLITPVIEPLENNG